MRLFPSCHIPEAGASQCQVNHPHAASLYGHYQAVPPQRWLHLIARRASPVWCYGLLFPSCPAPELAASDCWVNHLYIPLVYCRDKSAYHVNLGEYQLLNPSESLVSFPIKNIYCHPSYTDIRSSGDIALVELETPVNFNRVIRPICLPDSSVEFPTGMECWVTGWGNTKYEGEGENGGLWGNGRTLGVNWGGGSRGPLNVDWKTTLGHNSSIILTITPNPNPNS